ncbi:hypothetical protein Ndes2526B_g05462 [Nannochloris sp. 'desiccata']|nr:hypothetical protein KSW81_007333 [Chlorella desiccata (nom. nud.)]KAH7618558.1 hypothetical protein NADE_005407 [Chlorella desiccata (nom. nud.)]
MLRQIHFLWVVVLILLLAISVKGRSLRQDAPAPEIITDNDPRSMAGYRSSSWGLPVETWYETTGLEPSVE